MNKELQVSLNPSPAKKENRVVVRLLTDCYSDSRGVCFRRKIYFLKRKCKGFNFIEEEVDMVGAEDFFKSLTNLHSSSDGIYEMLPCNISTDWETGYCDGCDWKLVPFEEENKE